MTIRLLAPPYKAFLSPGAPPPLGAVLVAEGEDLAVLVAGLADAANTAPWCPGCLVARGSDELTLLARALEPIPGSFTTLDPAADTLSPEAVLIRVHERPPPDAETLARYVSRRLELPGVCPDLAACFREPGWEEGTDIIRGQSPRTLARKVAALGCLKPSGWRNLARLIRLKLAWEGIDGVSLDGLAAGAGYDVRTVRRWLRRAGVGRLRGLLGTPGWEWLLESALRKWGYVRPAGGDGLAGRWAGGRRLTG